MGTENPEIKPMDWLPFIRIPFKVWAVQVTAENIHECAELIGYQGGSGVMNGERFVADRDKIQFVRVVKIGYYITRTGDQWRVFLPDRFAKDFVPSTGVLDDIVDDIRNGAQIVDPNQLALEISSSATPEPESE